MMYSEYHIDKKIDKFLLLLDEFQLELTSIETNVIKSVLDNKNRYESLKKYSSEITKLIKKYNYLIDEDIAKTIIEINDYLLKNNIDAYKQAIKKGIIQVKPIVSTVNKRIIQKKIKQTKIILNNILKNIKVNSNKQIDTIIKDNIKQLNNGKSRTEIINNISNILLKKGIVIKENNRTYDDIIGYTRRVVKDISNKCYLETQEQLAKEIGIPDDKRMVEVSSHYGARPEHAKWQGKIYRYKDFVRICKPNTITGIMGINCRHTYFEFIEGISKPIFEHYNEKENERIYKLQQEQRANERKIRHWKRKSLIKEELGINNSYEKSKIKLYQAMNKKLVSNNKELVRRYDLEKI